MWPLIHGIQVSKQLLDIFELLLVIPGLRSVTGRVKKNCVFHPTIQATRPPRIVILKAGKRSKQAFNVCTVSVFHGRERMPP